MTAVVVVVVFVFIFFDVRQLVTNEYNARARTVVVGIATAATFAAAEERRRITEARVAVMATTEAPKLTDKAVDTINSAHGGDGGGGSPTLGGQSPAAPRRQRHPPHCWLGQTTTAATRPFCCSPPPPPPALS